MPYRIEGLSKGVALVRVSGGLELLHELQRAVTELEREARGVVIIGGERNFCSSAPPNVAALDPGEAEAAARRAHEALTRLSELAVPVIAAIDGNCNGAGLELALACHLRLATPRTRFGHGWAALGLAPAGGATWRLQAITGVARAATLLTRASTIDAVEARAWGLIEAVVPPDLLLDEAVARTRRGRPPQKARRGLLAGLGRRLELEQARRATPHTDIAARRILQTISTGISGGRDACLVAEARAFGELAESPECRRRVALDARARRLAEPAGTPLPRRLTVAGAGERGSWLAIGAARAGLSVRIVESDPAALAAALRRCRDTLEVVGRSGGARDRQLTLYRIGAGLSWRGAAGSEIACLAPPLDPERERRLVVEAAAACDPAAIIACLDPASPIRELAAAVTDPRRVVALYHAPPLFDPPLLEIAPGAPDATTAVATCTELGRRQGRAVLVLRAGASSVAARLAAVLVDEALHAVFAGAPIEAVDAALSGFGFRLGAFKLADVAGIDRIRVAARGLEAPHPALEDLLNEGRAGRKCGRGFYRWQDGAHFTDPGVYDAIGAGRGDGPAADEIVLRCLIRFAHEAVRCRAEGIVADCESVDVAAVFGTGFPPARGGAFHWIDSVGAATLVNRAAELRERLGRRFDVPAGLAIAAKTNRRFYGPPSHRRARRRRSVPAAAERALPP